MIRARCVEVVGERKRANPNGAYTYVRTRPYVVYVRMRVVVHTRKRDLAAPAQRCL